MTVGRFDLPIRAPPGPSILALLACRQPLHLCIECGSSPGRTGTTLAGRRYVRCRRSQHRIRRRDDSEAQRRRRQSRPPGRRLAIGCTLIDRTLIVARPSQLCSA